MAHLNKGVFGVRFSGGDGMNFSNLTIKDLFNLSPYANTQCGDYSHR